MNVVVLGSGSGASATAVDLAKRGFGVTVCSVYSPDLSRIKLIERVGGLEYEGVLGEGFARVGASTDLTCVSSAQVVVMVTLAAGHSYYADRLAGRLTKGQTLLLNPGYLGGMLNVARIIRKKGGRAALWETNNLPYVCRLQRPGLVKILRESRLLLVSSFPAEPDESEGGVSELYPGSVQAENVLETGMMNPNFVVHPPGMVLNAGWIEATNGGFYFYREGLTRTVSRMVEELDEERLRICKRLGVKTMSIVEYYRRNGYTSSSGTNVYDVFAKSEPNRYLKAPESLESRYILEDVPFGLVPLACFGRIAGVNTPVTDSLTHLASALTRRDFSREGMNDRKMGTAQMTPASLRRFLVGGTLRRGEETVPESEPE